MDLCYSCTHDTKKLNSAPKKHMFMAFRTSVRPHSRRTSSGRVTQVKAHNRSVKCRQTANVTMTHKGFSIGDSVHDSENGEVKLNGRFTSGGVAFWNARTVPVRGNIKVPVTVRESNLRRIRTRS